MEDVSKLQVLESTKGKNHVVAYEGFTYQFNQTNKDQTTCYYRCVRTGKRKAGKGQCNGKMIVYSSFGQFKTTGDHNHLPDTDRYIVC